MSTSTVTTFGPDGQQLGVETIQLPDAPAVPDVLALADQLASLTSAVDELILDALMGA